MKEMTEDEQRNMFFGLGTGYDVNAITYRNAVAWGQDRIKKLELENENLGKTILALSRLRCWNHRSRTKRLTSDDDAN